MYVPLLRLTDKSKIFHNNYRSHVGYHLCDIILSTYVLIMLRAGHIDFGTLVDPILQFMHAVKHY